MAEKHNKFVLIICVLQWVLTFLLMGPMGLLLLIYSLFTPYWWIGSMYLLYLYLDRRTPQRGGRRLEWVRNWTVFKRMGQYFPAKLHKTMDLSPEDNYLLCFHPHGVLSTGAFLSFATEATGFSKLFPGIRSHLSVLNGHFLFPIYRDYFLTSGSIGSDRKSLEYVLGGCKGRGNLVCLVPGGALEALDAHPGKYRFHLKFKHGFIRMAFKTGASLVPCISFGETNLYKQADNRPGTFTRRMQNLLTKVLGFSPPLFYAYWILPFSTPINTVVGNPIKVERKENPSRDEITDLKSKYLTSLQELFYKYHQKFDPSSEVMEIV